MSTATLNLTPINTADADFRAWGSALSAQLAAMGLVQTSDTGQINWSTVAKPTSTSQSMGYEIWRFNDSLQATAPIFIKIEYGSAVGAATIPAIWITVATSTNGAGTVGSQAMARKQIGGVGSNASAMACYFSGSTNRIHVALFVGSVAGQNKFIFFSVERVRDEAGVETSDTHFFATSGNAGVSHAQTLTQSGTIPAADTSGNTAHAYFVLANVLFGTEVALGLVYPQKGKLLPPIMGLLLHPGETYLTLGTTFSTSMYGASHTYIGLGHSTGISSSFSPSLAMRYE